MPKPVLDGSRVQEWANDSSIDKTLWAGITPSTSGQWIFIEIVHSPPGNASANPVASITNDGTALTWTKFFDLTSTGGGVSVWRAWQAVAQHIVPSVHFTATPTQVFWSLGVISTWTPASTNSDQTAAVNATATKSADATPSIVLTTTANNSYVSSIWQITASTGGTAPTFNNGTNTAFRVSSTDPNFDGFIADYTGSTATAGSFTQAFTLSGSVTTFTGHAAAWEILGAVDPIVPPQPLPPEVILAQYGIDPWVQPVPLTDLTVAPVDALAEVAVGTGSAVDSTVTESVPGALSSGTGTASNATVSTSVSVTAAVASGTGTAAGATAKESVPAGLSAGTGTASNATVSTSVSVVAGAATGTGAAAAATVSTSASSVAGVASGTGSASPATSKESVNPSLAAGTGTAYDPSVSTSTFTNANAQNAAGTGSANAPTLTESGNAALANGTGGAFDATVSTSSFVNAAAGNAAGTGTANTSTPKEFIPASLASGTGTAANATVTTGADVPAGNAAGTGTAQNATTKESVNAGLVSGTGTASAPTPKESVPAGLVTGTGAAANAAAITGTFGLAGNAAGTGTAFNAVGGVSAVGNRVGFLLLQNAPSSAIIAPAVTATGTGAVLAPATKVSVSAGLPAGTGIARTASASTSSGFAPGQRPFASSSPWNTPTPGGTTWFDTPLLHIYPGGGADQFRHWFVSTGAAPVWYGAPSDPLWTFNMPDYIAPAWNRNRPAQSFQRRAPSNMLDGGDSDHIVVLIDTATGDYVEVWNSTVNQGARTVTGTAWAIGNALTGPGAGTLGGLNDGVRAANFSWAGGLITGHDLAASTIDHALVVSLNSDTLKGGNGSPTPYVAPATCADAGGWTGLIIMGSRIGVPAGVGQPSGLSSIGVKVFNALKTYGAFVGDYAGGTWPLFYSDKNTVTNADVSPLYEFWNYGGSADMEKIGPLLRVADYQP